MKMAIVSSYSESCGNAAFTKILHDSIESLHPDVHVDVLELDLHLLQSNKRSIRKLANAHIKNLCKKIKTYDFVNIQMEPGLYGTIPSDITERFRWLLSSNPNTSVTLHSPRLFSLSSVNFRKAVKKVFSSKFLEGIKDFAAQIIPSVQFKINQKILKYACLKNARIIVHTLRAKRHIKTLFQHHKVDVHPLKMVPLRHENNSKTLLDIKAQTKLSDQDILIGIFGYISPYKGHLDAIRTLSDLPDNYKLLIFGRQHPQTLSSSSKPTVDLYLVKLIEAVKQSTELHDRVFFLGELDDEKFLDVVSDIDVCWLPYYENGQDGSGIASICLDLSPRVVCSSSFAFDELFKLIPYKNVLRFDVGNTLELATKTKMLLNSPLPEKPFGDTERYNITSQVECYLKDMSQSSS